MKLLIALAGCIALSAANAVPIVPADNSHYVEGESQYIWMQGGEEEPQLVDLQEPVDETVLDSITRNGANNKYWLFTRINPTSRQVLVHNNANSVRNSNFRMGSPIKVIVHGWNNDGLSPMNDIITSAFLAVGDVNVIVVDWAALASSSYNTAVAGVPSVGNSIGDFLIWLRQLTGVSWNNIHLVGFSLGAHIVGNAGRRAGGLPGRVTGLDPAGPGWRGNSGALNRNSGVYVEAIHTDAGFLGIVDAIGDTDFYPNGGSGQPGCSIGNVGCSHGRSTDLFAATVRFNHLVGRSCSNVSQAQSNRCTGLVSLNLGNWNLNKRGSGIFGLTTGSAWPY